MAPKRKPSQATKAGSDLNHKWLGVPTTFFGVEVDGARYLARAGLPHPTKTGMVWMHFEVDNTDVWAPAATVRGWTITDAEAAAESAVWYGVPPEDEDAPEQEQAAAEQDVEAALEAPKGKVVSGRWQPADTKRPPHAVDDLQWKTSTGAGYKPIIHPRKFPMGSNAKDGFQAPLPVDASRGVMLLHFHGMQWGDPAWELLRGYSEKRVVDMQIGTKEAQTKKPKMSARQDGSKGHSRKAPEMTVPFIMKLLIIVSAMGLMRLPARKYYWSRNVMVGNVFIHSIMSQNQFEQGMRCLASFDPAKLTARGDKRHPPPVGYDKMAKTRELDELAMAATLKSFCPDTKVRRRPYPPVPPPYPPIASDTVPEW